MRTILSIALIVFISGFVHAQDTLYRMNGTSQLVAVLEIKNNAIRYVSPSNGVIYNLDANAIMKIVFKDGTVKTFFHGPEASLNGRKVDSRKTDFGRNFISINILGVTDNHLTLGYEHTAKSGKSSFKIPFSINYGKQASTVSYDENERSNKDFSTGIDYYSYPYGQGTAKFFYGPAFEIGKRSVLFQTYNGGFTEHHAKTTYYALLLQFGYLFQPDKHLNISVSLGFGYTNSNLHQKYPDAYYSYLRNSHLASRSALNIGYKF